MALNSKNFITRTITAIVFAAVMLAGLLWNQWSFLILFSIIHFGCWWEYLKLAEKIYITEIDKAIRYFFCVCGYLVFLAVAYSHYSYDIWWSPFGVKLSLKWGLVIFAVACLFIFLFTNKKIPEGAKWFTAGGLFYISVSLGLMMSLRSGFMFLSENIDLYLQKVQQGEITVTDLFETSLFSAKGLNVCLIIVFSIWINDTMAYIVGSVIGKTQLSIISPKKTWEGTIGGVILTVLLMAFLSNFFVASLSDTVAIAAIAAIIGIFGDLLESKLKRMAGVKDSGNFMPGHGGFLDRFDSMLLAIPAVWIYVKFFMSNS